VFDLDGSPEDIGTVQIIDGEDSAALIFIADEGKSPGLPGLVVPHQIDVDDLPVLRKHSQDVSFREIE
jgi:hypothetical protein